MDIRDWKTGSQYINSINGTTTVDVWTDGFRRIDKQQVFLPEAFHSQVLDTMVLTDIGEKEIQRINLRGVTVLSVPEPSAFALLCMAAVGLLAFGRRKRRK